MKRSMLPLNALRAFDAAARHMSFKQAAEDLSVTPAAISQQIRSLEEYLGVDLFRRTNRALILTEAAQLSLAPLREGFEKLEEAVDALTAEQQVNVIRLTLSPSFAAKWLVPRLASYYERRPDAIVKISATMALTDFQAEDIDLAIRFGRGDYPGLYHELLLSESVAPVCAPSLLEGAKKLEKPEDILNFTLIHDDSFSEADGAATWPMWLRAAGVEIKEGLPALHFNTHVLAVDAAVAGRGVVFARSSIAEEDIKAGRLVRLFGGDTIPLNFAHHIVCPHEKLKSDRVKDFIDWLKEEAGTAAATAA